MEKCMYGTCEAEGTETRYAKVWGDTLMDDLMYKVSLCPECAKVMDEWYGQLSDEDKEWENIVLDWYTGIEL